MLTTQEQIEKGRKVFDSKVFAIPYAGDKYVELATSLIHTIREEDKAEMVKGIDAYVENNVEDTKFQQQWLKSHIRIFLASFGISK